MERLWRETFPFAKADALSRQISKMGGMSRLSGPIKRQP